MVENRKQRTEKGKPQRIPDRTRQSSTHCRVPAYVGRLMKEEEGPISLIFPVWGF